MLQVKSVFLSILLLLVQKSEPRLHKHNHNHNHKHNHNHEYEYEYEYIRKERRRHHRHAACCFCFDDNNYPSNRRKVIQEIIRQTLIIGSAMTTATTMTIGDHSRAKAMVMDSTPQNVDESVNDTTIKSMQTTRNNNSDNKDNNISSKDKFIPKKPFAPPSALIPAARVKYVMDESLRLLNELESIQSTKNSLGDDTDRNQPGDTRKMQDIIVTLEKLILVKTFMSPLYSQQQTQQQWQGAAIGYPDENIPMDPLKSKFYQDFYNEKLKTMSPIDIPYALLVKAGDIRQLKQLQRKQKKLEKINPVREAFNYYTRQLQFDTDYYLLNVSAQEKKKMIRNDELPDIQSVIVSDLDLRDLVRNQVLDAYDDVKFELRYQVANYEKGLEFDASGDLKVALVKAKKECDEWFSFISEKDVKEAMETVWRERMW